MGLLGVKKTSRNKGLGGYPIPPCERRRGDCIAIAEFCSENHVKNSTRKVLFLPSRCFHCNSEVEWVDDADFQDEGEGTFLVRFFSCPNCRAYHFVCLPIDDED